MCGGGGGGNGSQELADLQRREQETREARIRRGLSEIEALFEGGTLGGERADSFNPDQTYLDSSGEVFYSPDMADQFAPPDWLPTAIPDNIRDRPYAELPGWAQQLAHKGLEEDRTKELNSQLSQMGIDNTIDTYSELRDPMKVFRGAAKDGLLYKKGREVEGFDDDFYSGIEREYLDYANPEVDQQYGDALEDLTFALSRAGTLDSSISADRFGETEKDYRAARRRIADTASDRASNAREAVSNERSRLTQLTHATGDPSVSLAGVGEVLANLRNQPALEPIGPIFQNVTAGIGNYAEGRRYADMNRRLDRIFRDSNEGSGRTVR